MHDWTASMVRKLGDHVLATSCFLLSTAKFLPRGGAPVVVRFRLNPSVHKSGPLSVPRRRLRW